MQVWKNSLKNYKIGAYKHNEHKYFLSSQINSLEREYSFTYKTDEDVFRVKGKEYALTEENRKILFDKIAEFENEWSSAFREYENVFVNGCSDIYIKKLNKTRYHVFWLEDEELISFKGPLCNFLVDYLLRFYKMYSHITKREGLDKKVYDNIATDFLSINDEYVIALVKYLTNQATKEDVDFINEYENADYFFVDRDIYGIYDITDIKNIVLNRLGSMFGCRIYYELECKIDGKYYKMKYFPSNVESALWANSPQGKIKISSELLEKIKVLTGQTEENIKTLKLLQVNTFLYGDNDGISKRSIEQQNKVFNDLAKVSLEDIKALPKHWQAKLSTPLLYDWLKCTGYSGDRKANEFVENLVKNRKVGK
jgi:hypothetical protein